MGTNLRKLYYRLLYSIVITGLCCLLIVFVYTFFDEKTLRMTSIELKKIAQGVPRRYYSRILEKEIPFCVGNLLDQQEFHYSKESGGSYDSSRFTSKTETCRLLNFTAEHIVTCLDTHHQSYFSPNFDFSIIRPTLESISLPRTELYLAFMGDSRMRQQFLNFIRVIPDYDAKTQPSPIPRSYQGDIEFKSSLLGLRMSFKWRPLIDDRITETISQWTYNQTERPHLIVLSTVAWHMLREHGADYRLYLKKLTKLGPILGRLANVSRVIWLNQYPIVDFYGNNNYSNAYIHSEKIHIYNKAICRTLKNLRSQIRIWDSSNPLAEEYVRSCNILRREEKQRWFKDQDYTSAYFNCHDYIHTGYSALSQATQLLFNDICSASYTANLMIR